MSLSLLHTENVAAHWTSILRKNFRDWHKLAGFLELNDIQRDAVLLQPSFPLNLPYRLAKKIKKQSIEDPIFLQFIPLHKETLIVDGFKEDPVEDCTFAKTPRLLQKYQGRALLVTTGVCAMNCRYCFRQNYPYSSEEKLFFSELEMVREDTTLKEIILSGGDPLMLPDRILSNLFAEIENIEHIKKIRIHTRMPIGIPERIDEEFLSLIGSLKKQVWMVLHINHASELDADILNALSSLRKKGVVLLNQSVLLKGVNDSVDTLKELSELLTDNGIIPYYIHQLDRVQGAQHFEVEESAGKALLVELAALLPGYSVPRYVKEIAGQTSKTPV